MVEGLPVPVARPPSHKQYRIQLGSRIQRSPGTTHCPETWSLFLRECPVEPVLAFVRQYR